MHDVRQRICIGDHRHGTVVELSIQQEPWVCGFLTSRCQRVLKVEPTALNEVVGGRNDLWITRLIEVQTTGIIAWLNAESGKTHALKRHIRFQTRKIERFLSFA